MEHDSLTNLAPINLSKPFIKIVRIKINIDVGSLIVEFDGGIVKFKIFSAMSSLASDPSLCVVDDFDFKVRKIMSYRMMINFTFNWN